MELVVASNNAGKIREYRDILEPMGFQVFSQDEKQVHIEVEETGTTFERGAGHLFRPLPGPGDRA